MTEHESLVPVAILIKRHHPQKNLWKCKSLSGTSLEWLKDHYSLSGFRGDECLVEFPDEIEMEKGQFLYVDRNDFPRIPQHEIYLCDLLGKDVWVAGREGGSSYKIVGYNENSLNAAVSSVSLLLETPAGKSLEVPSIAIRIEKDPEKCFLNDAEMWESLDASSRSDEID